MTDQGFRFSAPSGPGFIDSLGGTGSLRIVLAGGDPLALAGLAGALGDEPDLAVVDQAIGREGDLSAAFRAVGMHHPDAVIWDWGLGTPAADLLAELAAHLPALVLVSGEDAAYAALAAGARGVVFREGAPERIAAAVRAVCEGLLAVDESLAPALLGRRPEGRRDLHAEPLTSRELEVVQLLAQGLSNRAIAGRLGISEHTAKFHVNAILGKLDAHTRTDAVVRAARLGLVLL